MITGATNHWHHPCALCHGCSSGFLFRFNDLTITSTLLDDIMTQPDKPTKERHIVQHDTRSLRDTRMLLSRGAAAAGGAAGGAGTGPAAGSSSSSGGALTGIALRDALTFIEENAHPRLWRLLAQTALERLDLNTAERAFVSVGDYAVSGRAQCQLAACTN